TDLDLAVDSDVFLHEFTHYVNHNAVGFNMGQMGSNSYGFSPFSGGVGEGVSDYFACTVNGDPVLGETAFQTSGGGRDLTVTSGVCPDNIYGQVHMDGALIGSVSWTLRETFGQTVTDQLVWGAVTLLQPLATHGDFAAGLVQTANDLVIAGTLTAADVTTVQNALDARGLSDCFQELLIAPGADRTTQMFGLEIFAYMFGGTCQDIRNYGFTGQSLFHFRATPAPGDVGVRLSVTLAAQEPNPDLSWDIYGRQGQHVDFMSGGMGMPQVSAYDYRVQGITAATGELVIDESSDPPFDPSETYHFVIVHTNCPSTEAVVSVEPYEPPQYQDAGVDAETADASVTADASTSGPDPKDGCSCGTIPAAGDALPLLLVGLFLLGCRRRRRRPTHI
ncbi:MAG: hypothetical protein ABI333_13175, partial [bacterium]